MATDPVRATSSAGVRRLGRYTLRYRIAQGGMASVYLAQISGSAGFEKWIAVKTIHPHIATSVRFVNMFLDEARLASKLDHPNLCSVFDFGEDRGTWFIAMEYLHGETFGVVARTGWSTQHPPPYEMVARILADAARGLHAAHELRLPSGENAGVVHRDVSPENIFVTYAGPTKIVDFGVARWKSQSQDRTVAGELKGKIAYMCPEQLREEPVDRRADIWSLGVVLWEVTVGRRLFRRKTDAGTVYAVLHDNVPRPQRFRPDYPPELTAIVLRALERDRDRRYPTALDFARALEQWLASTRKPTGTGEVSEYMHSLFAEQIAFRERLLRTARLEAPVEEVSEVWRSAPIDPSELESSAAELAPEVRRPSQVDLSEEATLLNPDRHLARHSLPPSPAPSPARASNPPIPLRTPRITGPLQLKLTPPSLTSASYRAQQSAKFPWWRRRGVPSLAAGGLLIVVSALVIAYWLNQPIASDDPLPPPSRPRAPLSVVTVPPPVAPPPPLAPPPTEPVAPPPDAAASRSPRLTVRHVRRPRAQLIVDAGPRPDESAASSAPGYLTFIATPDAQVFEGARLVGRTPMTDRSIPSGHHTFRFVPGGGLAAQSVQVDVQPGGSSIVEMRWQPAAP
ncbi:MAG: serine/threonine protein kinase [Deltaproteobacteria bacterium]|nr:serine/threonine protein kinase [Deltaproteobacteria bacterium]